MDSSKAVGIIPDFFHDIIAYIIPGYVSIMVMILNFYFMNILPDLALNEINLFYYFLSLIAAYVLGRFYEHLGYFTIHHRKFPFVGKWGKNSTPKWSLIFDEKEKSYTEVFKTNLKNKIEAWLKNQDGNLLMEECKDSKKDDYFNLIQFYLRERFPAVALYEKKQNATIVLTRSMAIIFFLNVFIYHIVLFIKVDSANRVFSYDVLVWILSCMVFAVVFYGRFLLDKKYHAMYIFETFIGMKKLLRKANV